MLLFPSLILFILKVGGKQQRRQFKGQAQPKERARMARQGPWFSFIDHPPAAGKHISQTTDLLWLNNRRDTGAETHLPSCLELLLHEMHWNLKESVALSDKDKTMALCLRTYLQQAFNEARDHGVHPGRQTLWSCRAHFYSFVCSLRTIVSFLRWQKAKSESLMV